MTPEQPSDKTYHMKTVLVTAFEPFGGETLNPTEMVLGMLPDTIGNHSIRKLVLPVEFGRSADIAIAEYDRMLEKYGVKDNSAVTVPEEPAVTEEEALDEAA